MGTLPAWGLKTQISQAQFRAKSGAADVEGSGAEVEAAEIAGSDGMVQIKAASVSRGTWS